MPVKSRSSNPLRLGRRHAAGERAVAPATARGGVYPGAGEPGGRAGKRADERGFASAGRKIDEWRVWSVNRGS